MTRNMTLQLQCLIAMGRLYSLQLIKKLCCWVDDEVKQKFGVKQMCLLRFAKVKDNFHYPSGTRVECKLQRPD